MNDNLSLWLELQENTDACVHLQLTIQNPGTGAIFLPFPVITGIAFERLGDGRPADWYTRLLVSTRGSGFALHPGQSRSFEWRVRPDAVACPKVETNDDYYRWSVDLTPGEYRVLYRFEVGTDFLDPDSHMRLSNLEQLAEREGAAVWLGRAESNHLTLLR
jgi:hypothetical protein